MGMPVAARASSSAELDIAGAASPPPGERARALVKRMNATEKYQLLSGVWGLGWAPPEEQVRENQCTHGRESPARLPLTVRPGIAW